MTALVRSVRPLEVDDLPAVMRIAEAVEERPWPRPLLQAELARDDRRYLVVCEDAEVVAYGGLVVQAGDAHVLTVSVVPDARRRGLGTMLVEALLEAAVAAGAQAATLEVRPSNGEARRLYRRLGFEEAGHRPGYYPDGEDAVIMWIDGLAPPARGRRHDRAR